MFVFVFLSNSTLFVVVVSCGVFVCFLCCCKCLSVLFICFLLVCSCCVLLTRFDLLLIVLWSSVLYIYLYIYKIVGAEYCFGVV